MFAEKAHRGCLSDTTATATLCKKEPTKCKICKERGCNINKLNPSKPDIKPSDGTIIVSSISLLIGSITLLVNL